MRTTAGPWLTVSMLGWMLSGCGGDRQTRAPQPDRSPALISPSLLEQAGLQTVWDHTLPLKKREAFAALTLLGDRFYLQSDRNFLWSLDRARGQVIFSRPLAAPGIPVLGLVPYENRLISVIGNRLVELDVASGQEQRVTDLGLSLVAPPARNSQFFYVSAADFRLHVFRAEDLVHVFPVTADNDSLITTIVADEGFVAFGTNAGNLVGMAPDTPRKLWQFKAPEAVAGAVVRDESSFYFASTDTNVYRVDVADDTGARLAWKYQCEAILDRSPRVTREFVYQYAVGRGLTALAKQSGRAAWSLPEGLDLLAEAGSRAYVISRNRTLVVMDNVTGKKLFAVNFAPVAHHATNTTDARLYLASETGRVVCLEPIQ
ncbi:MAG: PQQ-like beta-propeller repeat protein [Planctomycetes bacterium]|nr:PQQ-like beta-propeller repeat protein [Planctomycetota bacterium]